MLVYTVEAVDGTKLGGSFSNPASGLLSTVNATFTVPVWFSPTANQLKLDAYIPCHVGSASNCTDVSFMTTYGDVWTNEQFDGYLNPIPNAASVVAGGSGYGASVSGTMTWAGTSGQACATPPVLNVTTDGSGAIVSVDGFATAGSCNLYPATNATTWTPGGGLSAGTGAIFKLTSTVNLQSCPQGGGAPVCFLSYTWPISPNAAAGYRVRVHLGNNPDGTYIWGANLQVTPGAKCWNGTTFVSAPCLQNQPPPLEVPTWSFESNWNGLFARTIGGEAYGNATPQTYLGTASIKSATEADLVIPLNPPMFCPGFIDTGWCPSPTVSFGGSLTSLAACFSFDNGLTPTAVSAVSTSSQYIKLAFTVSGATIGQSTLVSINKACGILVTSRLDKLSGY
jgi:hypothetical protein